MLTERKFRVPIYDFKVIVTVFDDYTEARNKFPHALVSSAYGCTMEYIDCGKCHILIPSSGMSTVVHELEHVKNLIWKFTGYQSQAGNDEPDAYLMGYLYEQVEKILNIHKKLAS
jgi:hypothetical protein